MTTAALSGRPAGPNVSRRRLVALLLGLVFFVSGFAAILYQVVWQRTLFAAIGINIEAVTLIVTTFISGLGLGSLVGGGLSRATPRQLVQRFAAVELGVGAFGLVSLPLLHRVGVWTLGMSALGTGVVTFAVLVPPTLGMGATLPILVAYYVRRSGNVGTAVGGLYFVNTLGSAVAAFAAALWLMRTLGQSGVILVAACCNLSSAAVAFLTSRTEQP
jgi:spermidine synthase